MNVTVVFAAPPQCSTMGYWCTSVCVVLLSVKRVGVHTVWYVHQPAFESRLVVMSPAMKPKASVVTKVSRRNV
jgi:hypothetical protein